MMVNVRLSAGQVQFPLSAKLQCVKAKQLIAEHKL